MKQLTPIAEDRERVRRVQNALADSWFAALICSLPKHVLLLTGYWPVIGTSMRRPRKLSPVTGSVRETSITRMKKATFGMRDAPMIFLKLTGAG